MKRIREVMSPLIPINIEAKRCQLEHPPLSLSSLPVVRRRRTCPLHASPSCETKVHAGKVGWELIGNSLGTHDLPACSAREFPVTDQELTCGWGKRGSERGRIWFLQRSWECVMIADRQRRKARGACTPAAPRKRGQQEKKSEAAGNKARGKQQLLGDARAPYAT